MTSSVKFIYFDLGGIFFEWEKAFSTVAEKYDLDIQQIIRIFDDHDEEITKGWITPQELWAICQAKLDIKNGKDYDFLESWVSDYAPIPEVYRLAEKYSSKYKMGIISNIYEGMYPLLIEKRIVPDLTYRPIILSCEVGMRKPDTEIFELAQAKSGVQASEILFIDDSQMNLDIVTGMGWQTSLFETYQPNKSIIEIEKIL